MTVLELSLKLMLFIVAGYIARKLKVIADGFDKMLSRFVMAIPMPCMIINSFNIEFSVDALMDCPVLLALSIGSFTVMFAAATLVTRKMERGVGKTLRFALLFTNFTFLGLPVVNELYGAKGAFNYVIFTLPMRILFYGGAPMLLGRGEKLKGKELLRQFLCEPVVAVFIGFFLYVTQIRLPAVLAGAISTLGNMASPLGLILCGIILADADWSGMLKYRCVPVVSVLRLTVIPAVMVGAFLLLGVDKEIIKTTMYFYAMPVASLLPTFLLRYDPDEVEGRVIGGYIVVVSTLLCIATVPMWALLLEKL